MLKTVDEAMCSEKCASMLLARRHISGLFRYLTMNSLRNPWGDPSYLAKYISPEYFAESAVCHLGAAKRILHLFGKRQDVFA
jgi:hypothetical protein